MLEDDTSQKVRLRINPLGIDEVGHDLDCLGIALVECRFPHLWASHQTVRLQTKFPIRSVCLSEVEHGGDCTGMTSQFQEPLFQ